MQCKIIAALAATSLLFVGQHTLQAGGQPQCDTGRAASAPQQPNLGKAQDVASQETMEARKQADTQKYQQAGANSANAACEKQPSSVTR